MTYAIMRLEKFKTLGEIAGAGKHCERERETLNADPARRDQNERIAGTGDWLADAKARLATQPKIRSNAVLGIGVFMSASPAFFAGGTRQEQLQRCNAWRDASMAWLYDTFNGKENTVEAVLHKDELTPHLHCLVIPIDKSGCLNARHFVGGERNRLAQLQDSYAAAVAPLGLERGARGSGAEHTKVRDWYAQMQQPTHEATREITEAVRIQPPSRVVPRPEQYAEQERQRVIDAIRPAVDDLARRVDELTRQAQRQERQIKALAAENERHRAAERGRRQAEAPERGQADLGTVVEALGGKRDGGDRRAWRLGGEAIAVSGETFHNRDRNGRGTGAIGLVEYHTGYSFKEAVAWLRHNLGPDTAIRAAGRHIRQIVEQETRPPFREPERDEAHWSAVRAHLTGEHHLAPSHIDALHAGGTLYADRFGRAVFLHRDERGTATGASLWSTQDGGKDLGLAAGTQLDAPFFEVTSGTARALGRPMLVLAESPVEALSWLELHRREHGPRHAPVTVISLDETGTLPHAAITRMLEQGGHVRVATGNHERGEQLWHRVREQHQVEQVTRDRPSLKWWNEVLRDPVHTAHHLIPTRGRARSSPAEAHEPRRDRSEDRGRDR